MNIKLFFGILSIIPAVIAYYLYFKGMFAGKTKPQTFSWLVWGILAGNGFLAQVSAHAGIGAWATGLTSVASLTIFCFSIWLGTTQPTRFDWSLLSIALIGLLLLLVVNNKDIALCLTLGALISAFVMTIRKAYGKPLEENAVAFLLNAFKFLPAILAITNFSFLTVAYPLVAGVGNAAVAIVVYGRNKRLSNNKVLKAT